MTGRLTFGQVIVARRAVLGLSLKVVADSVHKENGQSVAAQYIHDIERDRRIPSPHVLGEIARALGLDGARLAAVAGQALPEVTEYLRDQPDTGPAVAAFFARAREAGFVAWDKLALPVSPATKSPVDGS